MAIAVFYTGFSSAQSRCPSTGGGGWSVRGLSARERLGFSLSVTEFRGVCVAQQSWR